MSHMTTKLPWLLAALPLMGAVYAGCGSSGTPNNAFLGDGGGGASSGFQNSSSGSSGDDGANDSPTSNAAGDM